MTTENSATKQAGDAPASGDDPFGLASWMRWWLPVAPQPRTAPGLSIPPRRLAELQDAYIKAMTAIWNDFVAHPDRAAAPIRDRRFSDPAWQENSLASFAAKLQFQCQQLAEQCGCTRPRIRLQELFDPRSSPRLPVGFIALAHNDHAP